MKIGFYSKWDIIEGRFVGDHLYAGYLSKNLKKFEGVESVEMFAPNKIPIEKLDFMIYLNDTLPTKEWANKNILYFQNGYEKDKAVLKLKELVGFDLYLFVSKELMEISKELGYPSELLTFGAETSVFYPREKDEKFAYEVAYVGNDIKGEARSTKYILPATDFNFGLFGNWKFAKKEIVKYWYFFMPRYKKIFRKISRGKISNDDISVLYSSSKINLNCTSQGFVDFNASTARPFEILACGGFLITDDIPYLREVLGDGAVYTMGGDDLKEKIKYYLEHEKERNEIKKHGHEKVMQSETVFEKAKLLYGYLKKIK